MTTKTFSFISVTGLVLSTGAAIAQAQPETSVRSEVAPISNALEIAIGGAYMQHAGDIGGGMASIDDLSRGGGGAELQIGYRVTPNLTLGAYGTLSGYDTGPGVAPSTDLVIGATAGIQGGWHFRPTTQVDPWVSVGTGWRALWLGNDNATESKLQGLELARVQAGLDYRITPSIAITPYVGASASMFLARGDMTDGAYTELSNKELNWSFTGGVMGRFDLFGRRGN